MANSLKSLKTRILLRNDSADNWDKNLDKILLKGEVGLEFNDSGNARMKIGDGETTWEFLPYFGEMPEIEIPEVKAAQVFQVDLQADETDHVLAINRVISSENAVANEGDTAIVRDGNSISGKTLYTAYVYDNNEWTAMDGNYNANNVYFDEDMMVTTDIGYITTTNGSGTIPSKGKNLAEVFEAMFVQEQDPEMTEPSVSVTLTGAGSYEVGTIVTGIKYSASFDDGNYTYGPEPTGASVSDWTVTDTAGGSYKTTSSDLADVTVIDGINFSVTAKATHSAGDTPKTNKGNDCTDTSKKIPAGVKSKTSSAITGYRSFFYGVLDTSTVDAPLTSDIIRGLTNGKNYNGAKSFTLNGSATAKRMVIAIPSSSTRGKLKEVILTSAMNTPITDSYTLTAKAVKVEGVDGYTAVDYDVYVYEPASIDAGEVHAIKLA